MKSLDRMDTKGTALWIVLLLTGLSVLISCSKDHDPVSYNNPIDNGQIEVPPVPEDLQARVGDRAVELSWTVSNTSDIRSYRIARRDSLTGDFAVIDSVDVTSYRDSGLKNGRPYRYRVCAVNTLGYVGSYSHEISAIPSGFTLTINGGDRFTSSTAVNLSLSAPGGAGYILLANDSLFSGASWEPFINQKSWTLTAGDGTKVVFLKVRDLDDNESCQAYRDDIILDTRAGIASLTFSPADSLLTPGDVIHFSMDTGEEEGQASLDIGTAAMNKELFDDGTRGDDIADDGVYQLDYTVPSGLDVIDAVVTRPIR